MHMPTFTTLVCSMLAFMLLALTIGDQPAAQAQAPTGIIAYVRAGGTASDQIRLIEPDGSGDRPLWSVPNADPKNVHDISSLTWRPDATELAFGSDHEDACSMLASDIYAIRPDGSGLRRMTNPPPCATLNNYPQGSVTINVRNRTMSADTLFFVYVQGAPSLLPVTLLPGAVSTVTFPSVADFGAVTQQVVVVQAAYRWAGGEVDVRPGQPTTSSPSPVAIFGEGIPEFGAWGPTWRSDGSRIGHARSGMACLDLAQTPADNAPAGALGAPVLQADREIPCSMAWGPTSALADQVLYTAIPGSGTEGIAIYRVTEGDKTSNGVKLVTVGTGALLLWYDWLPDGSGFLFVQTTKFVNTRYVESNLFEYNFATRKTTQVTWLTNEFVRSFGVSPDSQQIVFERAAALDSAASDLWIVDRNGSGVRLLVENGRIPNWSRQNPGLPPSPQPPAGPTPQPAPQPPVGRTQVYLPLLRR